MVEDEDIKPSVPDTVTLDIFGRVHEPGDDDQYKPLLARRVARESVVVGRAYVLFARRGGVGVAVEKDGCIGYRLRREKWGDGFLFVEYDFADDVSFGTAIPLTLIEAEPPTSKKELLEYLANQEDEHRAEINAARELVLGPTPELRRRRGPE